MVELGHGPPRLVAAHVVQRTLGARAIQVSVEAVETAALAVPAAVRGRVLVRRARRQRVVEAPVVVRAGHAGSRQARGRCSREVAASCTDTVEINVERTHIARLHCVAVADEACFARGTLSCGAPGVLEHAQAVLADAVRERVSASRRRGVGGTRELRVAEAEAVALAHVAGVVFEEESAETHAGGDVRATRLPQRGGVGRTRRRSSGV